MKTQEQNSFLNASSVKAWSDKAIGLLKELIAIPSFSKEEDRMADRIESFLNEHGVATVRKGNNVWAKNKYFDDSKPVILLNSHHDTVKPNAGYTIDPFFPLEKEGKIYGLGSNDAGASLVSLIAVFLHVYELRNMKANFIFAASAEEEISGYNGIEIILPELGNIDFAIVGEPTQMNLAISEKGLLVLDCVSEGKAGHAAREEGENALYKALRDIAWFRDFRFPKISGTLGPVKMSVTMIHSGSAHNVVPDRCEFTVDIRSTDVYTNEEILEIVRRNVSCDVKERSLRMRPSSIPVKHPIVQKGLKLGRIAYGSPTCSDQTLMPFTSVKIGPGDSARSHSSDEFIEVKEIEEGIQIYLQLISIYL